jgi:hypothetical protein
MISDTMTPSHRITIWYYTKKPPQNKLRRLPVKYLESTYPKNSYL